MKRITVVLMALVLLTSCSFMGKITDAPIQNWSAYAAGRTGFYVVDGNVSTAAREALEYRYDAFLAETAGVLVIEPTQTMSLVNDMAIILSSETSDPYGLLMDLLYGLKMFGAEFVDGYGEMTSIQPVPRNLFVSFSDGWRNSRLVESLGD
jgi:hypothetical protein